MATETLTDNTIGQLIREATPKDKSLAPIIKFLSGHPQEAPAEIQKAFEDYELVDGLLLRRGKICVPKDQTIRRRILESRHDSPLAGHPGRAKTLELTARTYYWPTMSKFVFEYVDTCDACNRTKPLNQKTAGLLQPLPVPPERWTDISYDFITDLPMTKKGHDAILNVVDRFSKRAHFIPCNKTINAEGTARLFLEHVWKLHGTPNRTVSDRGTTFNSAFMRELYKNLGIEPSFSTAYHPQTDGQTERVNQSLEQFLRLYTSHLQDDWDEWLPIAEFQYNNSVNSSTGFTPFYVDEGRHPQLTPKALGLKVSPAADQHAQRMVEVTDEVKSALVIAQERHHRGYDQGVRTAPSLEIGDKVWLSREDPITHIAAIRTTRPSQKLEHRRFGPYKILAKIGTSAYRLELPSTMKVHPVFHISRLTPAKKDTIEGRTVPPPEPVVTEEGLEYEVEEVLDSRWSRGRFQYYVRWKGYDTSHDQWNYFEDTTNADDAVEAFHSRNPTKPHPSKPPRQKTKTHRS